MQLSQNADSVEGGENLGTEISILKPFWGVRFCKLEVGLFFCVVTVKLVKLIRCDCAIRVVDCSIRVR